MEAKKIFSKIGWAYAIFFLIAAGVQYGLSWLIMLQEGEIWEKIRNMDTAIVLSHVSMYLCAFPVFFLIIKKLPVWKRNNRNKLGGKKFFLYTMFCFGITYIGNILGNVLMLITRLILGKTIMNPVESIIIGTSPWLFIFSVVIVAPIMEELLFRKLLIDRIIPYGQKTAIILSGLSFGLAHGNFFQFFYACAIGMLFAYLYSSTGHIRYNILLHMIVNFMGGVVPMILLNSINHEKSMIVILGAIMLFGFMIASIITAVVLTCCLGSKLTFFPPWVEKPVQNLWKVILLAPGVIGFIVVSILLFIIQ